ncbi:MAG TPA: hypothetical protein PLD02_17045, partial [Saprospiraceae bacterium]|nr:hypothetical protein [Saprospiraceae bacterium]
VIGILDNNTTTTGETISQNTIYNISNTYTASSLAVNSHGMNLTFSGSGHTIRRNLVYDIKLSNSSTSAELCGIKLLGGNPTISNNMLTIGNGLTNNPFINAINLQGGAPKIYFNTVVLTGAAAGASSAFTNVIRIQGVSSGSEFIDNIFYNNRTSNSATSNQCMFFTTVAQRDNVTTCNYNNLFNNVANTVLVSVTVGSPYANLAAWQANSGGRDANSLSQTLNFVAIANDLHLTDCTMAGKGTDITGITIDYDNSTRNSPPWIGADEPFKTWSGGVGTWNTPTSWTPSGVPASYNDVLINSGTVTLDVNAICHSIKIASLAILTASTFKITLDASACIASFFSNSGTFNANTGTVQFDGASSILSGSIAGSTATIFNKVILNTGVTFPLSSSPTIGDTLRLNSGSYLNTSAPNYAMGSVLLYYTGNASPPYDRGLEWSAGSGKGYPYNVRISNNTTLRPAKDDETYNSVTFSLANDLTIDAGSSLYMDFNDDDMLIPLIIGNDIFISGNLS